MCDAQENNVNIDALIEQHIPLVKSTAEKITFNNDEYEDALQNGYVGLLKAAKKYDPAMGNFGSYAKVWVRGEILKGLREDRTIQLPSSEFRRRKEAQEEIKENKTSFEGLQSKGVDIPTSQKGPDEIIAEKQTLEIIQDEIPRLPAKEKLVVVSFLDGIAVNQIANHLGVTKTRVYQIYYKAISRMKKRFE